MSSKSTLILALSALATYALGAENALGTWAKAKAEAAGFASGKGPWTWRVGWATGNLAADPALALAERQMLDDTLSGVAAPGDRLGTFGFEMAPWGAKPEVVLGSAAADVRGALDRLPTTPAADSRGGRDVERALVAGATASPGAIVLVVSPGPSQAPLRGRAPQGEAAPAFLADLKRLGYRPPERFTVTVDVAGSPRPLMASLLLPKRPPAASASAPRAAFPPSPRPATPAARPFAAPLSAGSSGAEPWSGNSALCAVLAGLLGLTAGLLVARRPAPARVEPTILPPEPATVGDAGLDAWREEAARLRRALDLVAQDLGETSAGLRTDLLASGEARQEAHRLRKGLEGWDGTAIDFLDAARRAAAMDGLSAERRETWAKAARDFARLVRARGLDVIAPEPGEPFVDGHHRAESVVSDPAAGDGRVAECLSWGFRRGDAVLRPASVVLALPSR